MSTQPPKPPIQTDAAKVTLERATLERLDRLINVMENLAESQHIANDHLYRIRCNVFWIVLVMVVLPAIGLVAAIIFGGAAVSIEILWLLVPVGAFLGLGAFRLISSIFSGFNTSKSRPSSRSGP